MGPNYPKYPSQPNQGRVPSMWEMGPPDLRPTSSTASAYQRNIDKAHGRWLAGLGSDHKMEEPAYAFNELQVMAEMDDIQGNGIFDPYGSQKNIHPSAGVFATNYNLPGYHAREVPFSLSEERDVTTGRRIRAVPSGAVANDSSAQIAFMEQGLYPRPQPMMSPAQSQTPFAETWNVMQNPEPVKGLGLFGMNTPVTDFVIQAALGYLVGLAVAPSTGDRSSYAMAGALAGGLLGTWGMAGTAAVALGGVSLAKDAHRKLKSR